MTEGFKISIFIPAEALEDQETVADLLARIERQLLRPGSPDTFPIYHLDLLSCENSWRK